MNNDKVILMLLLEMGFKANHSGYRYLKTAIEMVIMDYSIITKRKVTKVLYAGVATTYGTTPTKVERAMRTAIEHAHKVKNPRYHQVIGRYYHGDTAPTNSFFLAQCAEAMRLDLAS